MSESTFDPTNLSRDHLTKAVRHVTGEYPRDILDLLNGSSEMLEWLADLFVIVDQSARDGKAGKAARFARLGKYLAQDYGNYMDSAHCTMLEHMVASIGLGGEKNG